MERCITSETNPIVIKRSKIIDIAKPTKVREMVDKISKETGVPWPLITVSSSYVNQWIKIGNEWYFYKRRYPFHLINELLGEVISQYFDLDTVHYQIAKLCIKGFKEEYVIISKNFCDPNNSYETARNLNMYNSGGLNVLDNLSSLCESERAHELLVSDLKKMFICDFYTSQKDRGFINFLFIVNKEGIRLAPLYDYELSFESSNPKRYVNKIAEIDMNDIETICRLRYDDEFQRLLHMIIDAKMKIFIQMVEDNHHILIPTDYRETYLNHDKEMKKIVSKSKALRQ